ncbi:MAG: Lrp/AsnC family transcriptional regulator [Deltaproteobacteria bacterium]|nr:Lrp/AsnC family transcriptional regulator [Deltaproteobacteria bacterium]
MKKNYRKEQPRGVDTMDCRIIELLQQDGRMSNTDMARHLGVSESTVRLRLNRLIEEKYLQIVAVSDPIKLGFDMVGDIRIQVDIKKMDSILEELGTLKALWFSVNTTGKTDIVTEFVVRSLDELNDLLFNKINKIDGVQSTETNIFLNFVKRRYDWGTAIEDK